MAFNSWPDHPNRVYFPGIRVMTDDRQTMTSYLKSFNPKYDNQNYIVTYGDLLSPSERHITIFEQTEDSISAPEILLVEYLAQQEDLYNGRKEKAKTEKGSDKLDAFLDTIVNHYATQIDGLLTKRGTAGADQIKRLTDTVETALMDKNKGKYYNITKLFDDYKPRKSARKTTPSKSHTKIGTSEPFNRIYATTEDVARIARDIIVTHGGEDAFRKSSHGTVKTQKVNRRALSPLDKALARQSPKQSPQASPRPGTVKSPTPPGARSPPGARKSPTSPGPVATSALDRVREAVGSEEPAEASVFE